MEMNNRIVHVLSEYYDIAATHIEQRDGGWSALAYFIEDKSNQYFLKVFDKNRPSVVQWISAIDRYVPLTNWLYDHTLLHDNLVRSIPTQHQSNKCEDEDYVYMLSEYTKGITIGKDSLNDSQVQELAKIIGVLHHTTSRIPNKLRELQIHEEFQIDFCNYLSSFICHDLTAKNDAVLQIVKPHISCLLELVEKMKYLSRLMKSKPQRIVLSHADAHNWNIMQGRNLVLIDWECLKLAPQEQDLVLHITTPYATHFITEYRKHTYYKDPDYDAFEFYYLKRILEDIAVWIKDVRVEGLVKSENTTLAFLEYNLNACTRAGSFRSNLKNVL